MLAIVRLPVELREQSWKWAHIWKIDYDTIAIKFSEKEAVKELYSVHHVVHVTGIIDVEKRLERLKEIVEGLLKGNNARTDSYYADNSNKKGPDRDNSLRVLIRSIMT